MDEIPHRSSLDSNSLNENSIIIKKADNGKKFVFLDVFGCRLKPFNQFLYHNYESSPIPWNDFFQIVVFLCLAPNVSVFYALLSTQSEFNGLVDFETVKKITKLFETDILTSGVIEESFNHLDINDDGYLSLHQFFNFASRTAILWKPLYYFRITLLEIFFPEANYANIFTRKLNIRTTIDYMLGHNGSLPSLGCREWFVRKVKGIPHPLKCDYMEDLSRNSNNRPSIQFSELTEFFVKLYNHEYVLPHENFSSKHLKSFTTTETLSNIDNYYVLLRKKYRWKESLSSITYSSVEFNFKVSATGGKKSILKQQSSRRLSNAAITPMVDEIALSK